MDNISVQTDIAAYGDILKRQIMLSLNCHALGQIESFDASTQTCTATVGYKRKINDNLVDYQQLVRCPVHIVRGGKSYLSMPIVKGDGCLVLFNDRDMDNWIENGQVVGVNSNRLHAFNDAIIIVGVSPVTRALNSYDSVNTVLYAGDGKIGLSNSVTDLKAELTGLINTLITLTTAMSAATPGTVVAAIATPSGVATTQLTARLTTLAGLLK